MPIHDSLISDINIYYCEFLEKMFFVNVKDTNGGLL